MEANDIALRYLSNQHLRPLNRPPRYNGGLLNSTPSQSFAVHSSASKSGQRLNRI